MINVQNIASKLASMPDAALKQYAEMHKDDPYTFSLALSESNRRKQMRSQAPQAEPQPKVVDQELENMKMLPEDTGIARLPIDMNMASGGIVAFNDGGMSHFDKGGTTRNAGEGFTNDDDSDAFKYALNNTLTLEGGLNNDDPVGGLTKYGISQKAYPKLDIANLTPADAAAIYKRDYWNKINGDEIAKKDPKLAALAFDTAVQHGVQGAKNMLSQSGDDPAKLLQIRSDKLNSLVQNNPETYGPQAKGWANRIAKLAYTLAPGSTAQAEPQPSAPQEVKTPSWRDYIPNIGGDKVSDQSLGDLIAGRKKPAPEEGPSATFSGVGKALKTKEGLKRAGIGALEDSTLGIAGMPADLSRTMPTSSVPMLRILGTGAEYLRNKFAPSGATDIGTTEYLKRKATEAGIRPEDSTDPNLRVIQSGGEFAGYFANPINALRSGAGKIGNVIREGRAELSASGLQSIADKKAAVAAAAKAQADAAAQSANTPRLMGPQPIVQPTRPVTPTPGISPQLTPQPAGFPVSEEALRLKQQATEAAAARATQRPAAATEPSLVAKVELDKMEAARKARIASKLAEESTTAKAIADAKAAEIVNNAVKTPPRKLPGKTAAIINADIPNITTDDSASTTEDENSKETQSLLDRYPAPVDYNKGVGQRDAGYGSKKEIIAAAKEAVPKSEDTDGWSGNDWLQFGLSMMAGQSPYALSNIGAAGLGVIASKAERQKQQNQLANYKAVHGAPAVQIAERLMANDPSLSFEDALARGTELNGGGTKQNLADIKADQAKATNLKNFESAKEKLDTRYQPYLAGTGPAAQAAQTRYAAELQELYKRFGISAENVASPTANVIPGAKIVGTR
jgi:lysozyme family protein